MADEINYSCQDILPAPTDGNLPGEVMVSILLNLPVKSLLKFKSVSKPWYSLISSHSFFKLHIHRQTLVPNNSFFVSFGDWLDYNCDFGLLIHNEGNTSDIDHLLTLQSQSSFTSVKEFIFIIGSCNGLVCLYTHSCGFILWNPATKKFRYLEYPVDDYPFTLDWFSFGLCYVEATNDFKLVGWTNSSRDNPTDRLYLFLYSSSLDSWVKLEYYDTEYSLVSFHHPTFLSGCMHWLVGTCTCNFVCTCARVIVALDVTDGSVSCFGAPDKNRGFQPKISVRTFVIKGCLSIVIDPPYGEMERGFDVWVMVEYGVEESWVKQFTIQGLTQVSMPLLTWNDSVIVFTGKPRILTFYDPYSKKKYCRQSKSFGIIHVLNYVESLAPVEAEEGIVHLTAN